MNPLKSSLDALANSARRRNLVAIVGADLLTVRLQRPDGSEIVTPFYDAVAAQIQQDHGLPDAALEGAPSTWMLHRVAAALSERGDSHAKVRQTLLAAILKVQQRVLATPALDALARLSCFDLFVCLTPDDLLVRALKAAQGSAGRPVDVVSYAPNEAITDIVCLPDGPVPAPQLQVYHLLGSGASRRGYFAIHEEEALEYLHRFREAAERNAKSLISELRLRDALYLGCNLPDWMGRGLVRLLNESPLQDQDRTLDYFCAGTRDARLSGFLSRFSPNSVVFPWEAAEFVEALGTLLPAADASAPAPPPPVLPRAARAAPTVFVSYARDDADAVRALVAGLRRVGFGRIWFDEHEIVSGDDWAGRIDEALDSCDYFMPVLSRQADERREGVFWQEWRRALIRSLKVADAFLLPVGIDALSPERMNYRRIFKSHTSPFAAVDLLHARAGVLGGEGEAQLRERLRRDGGGGG
jgi:hypothetical protein